MIGNDGKSLKADVAWSQIKIESRVMWRVLFCHQSSWWKCHAMSDTEKNQSYPVYKSPLDKSILPSVQVAFEQINLTQSTCRLWTNESYLVYISPLDKSILLSLQVAFGQINLTQPTSRLWTNQSYSVYISPLDKSILLSVHISFGQINLTQSTSRLWTNQSYPVYKSPLDKSILLSLQVAFGQINLTQCTYLLWTNQSYPVYISPLDKSILPSVQVAFGQINLTQSTFRLWTNQSYSEYMSPLVCFPPWLFSSETKSKSRFGQPAFPVRLTGFVSVSKYAAWNRPGHDCYWKEKCFTMGPLKFPPSTFTMKELTMASLEKSECQCSFYRMSSPPPIMLVSSKRAQWL